MPNSTAKTLSDFASAEIVIRPTMPTGLSRYGTASGNRASCIGSFPAVLWLLPSGGESTIHTASTSKITPPAIDNDPIQKCSKLRNSSPSTIISRATAAAVVSILRSTRRLVAGSRGAVISTNGTSAIFGPIPISSTRNVSIAPAAVIDVSSISKSGGAEAFRARASAAAGVYSVAGRVAGCEDSGQGPPTGGCQDG